MAKHPTRGKHFEYRSGYKGFAWGGMATKVDPGGNPTDRPRALVNTRIQGGSIISRPDFSGNGTMVPQRPRWDTQSGDVTQELGWEKVGSAAWGLHWAAAMNPAGPIRMWFGGDAGAFGFIDTDYEYMTQLIGIYPSQAATGWGPDMAKFNNEFYVGDYGSLRKIHLISPLPGIEPVTILSTPSDEIISTFPGFRVSSMKTHAGKLFFVLSDPLNVANGFVYSWDGQVITLELALTSPAASGSTLTTFFDTLVLTIAGFASIQVRDAAGAWTSHTVGGFAASGKINSTAVYRSKLYIMSGGALIHSWDGTNVVLARTIAVGGRTPNHAHVCAVMQGRFYYFWTDTTPDPTPGVIGYKDEDNTAASQWVDVGCAPGATTSFILTVGQAGGSQDINVAVAVQEYRARLWLVVGNAFSPTVPDSGVYLYTHQRQYMPWDGWHVVDGVTIVPTLGIAGPGRFSIPGTIRSLRRL